MRSLRQKRLHRAQSNSSSTKRTPTPVSDEIEQWRLEASIVSLLTLADKDNRLISPPFRVLPTPQEFPLYYEHIKKPIDLRKISQNIRSGKYQTWAALKEDVQLMCKNARDFNEPGSAVHKDANTLLRHFKHRSTELAGARRFSLRVISQNTEIIDELLHSTESEINEFSEDSEEDEDSERSDDPCWRLYWAIRNYDVVDGVPLCENFIELPCKRSYPDYYEDIERPLSLYMINKLLKRGHYTSLDSLVQDLLLMFDNAMNYNIEESGIYQAAIRFRQLTLKAAKALSSGDIVNGCSLPTVESYETDKIQQQLKPVAKRGRPRKTQDQLQQKTKNIASPILTSPSSQQTLSNTSTFRQQCNQGISLAITPPIQSQSFASEMQNNVTTNIVHNFKNQPQSRAHYKSSPLNQHYLTGAPSTTLAVSSKMQNTDPGRIIISAKPKQHMSSEPMFFSPSTSVQVRRVVHSEAYIRYLESMHNSGGKQQRNVSKWDKSLLASERNTVIPEHKRLPYDWIRYSSNGSKNKEDEIVHALWKLREYLVEDTTGITRSQGISHEAEPLLTPGYNLLSTKLKELKPSIQTKRNVVE